MSRLILPNTDSSAQHRTSRIQQWHIAVADHGSARRSLPRRPSFPKDFPKADEKKNARSSAASEYTTTLQTDGPKQGVLAVLCSILSSPTRPFVRRNGFIGSVGRTRSRQRFCKWQVASGIGSGEVKICAKFAKLLLKRCKIHHFRRGTKDSTNS